MKKTTTLLAFLLLAALQTVSAANINIAISGFTYSPNATTANVGDVVTISASITHPLVQVDQTTWIANGNTPLVGGWGTQTSAYTFTITTATPIYYVCANHVATMQMKGVIAVNPTGISQIAAAYNISMYPNPVVNNEFSVKVEGYNSTDGKVMLYDVEGKLAETHPLTGVVTAVKTKLPSGVYFYTVMIGNTAVKKEKFIVNTSK